MKPLPRPLRHKPLHNLIHETHHPGDIDEELLLQQFGVVLGEDGDGGFRGGADGGREAQKGQTAVVVDLGCFVGVVVA